MSDYIFELDFNDLNKKQEINIIIDKTKIFYNDVSINGSEGFVKSNLIYNNKKLSFLLKNIKSSNVKFNKYNLIDYIQDFNYNITYNKEKYIFKINNIILKVKIKIDEYKSNIKPNIEIDSNLVNINNNCCSRNNIKTLFKNTNNIFDFEFDITINNLWHNEDYNAFFELTLQNIIIHNDNENNINNNINNKMSLITNKIIELQNENKKLKEENNKLKEQIKNLNNDDYINNIINLLNIKDNNDNKDNNNNDNNNNDNEIIKI